MFECDLDIGGGVCSSFRHKPKTIADMIMRFIPSGFTMTLFFFDTDFHTLGPRKTARTRASNETGVGTDNAGWSKVF